MISCYLLTCDTFLCVKLLKQLGFTLTHLGNTRTKVKYLRSECQMETDFLLSTSGLDARQQPCVTPAFRATSKKTTSKDSRNGLKKDSRKRKLSQTLEADLTSKEKGFEPYWNEVCQENSLQLWSPTLTGSQGSGTNLSTKSSNETVGRSWFSASLHNAAQLKNSPKICSQSLQYFQPGTTGSVSTIDSIEAATILTTDDTFRYNPERAPRWAALAKRAAVARTWGDCYGYVLVATGRAEVMVDDRLSPWDAASLIPIITEAGGVYTDWRGGSAVDGGDGIAINGLLSEVTRQALVRADWPPVRITAT